MCEFYKMWLSDKVCFLLRVFVYVWVCVCMDFVIRDCVYVLVFFMWVCVYVWLCLCVDFVMCGCS